MERFVFVTAVAAAIIFGIVAVFGDGHIGWDWDEADAHGVAEMVEVSPGRLEAQSYSGADIEIRHAAAMITVISEDRQDFSVEIDNGAGRAPTPTITTEDDEIRIDGHLRGRIEDCDDDGVELKGYGTITREQMPRITIRAPRSLSISVSGASNTEIGATQRLSADFAGCGDSTVGDVAEELTLDLAGSGQVRAGTAGSLDADIAGSGDVTTGAIADGADVSIAGSGTITIASLTGRLDASGAGSGALTVSAGAITDADISLAGSGDVEIAATVARLEASIVGSGDVDVTNTVGDIDAEIAGPGNVTAQAVTGNIRRQIMGPGEVNVGQQ